MAERVGHRCMVHLAEAIDAELRDEDFYGAAIVSYSLTARPWNYIIHFDDGTAERVRLPDSSIRMLGTTLPNCKVRKQGAPVAMGWGVLVLHVVLVLVLVVDPRHTHTPPVNAHSVVLARVLDHPPGQTVMWPGLCDHPPVQSPIPGSSV